MGDRLSVSFLFSSLPSPLQQTLQLLARTIEALPFASEEDKKDVTTFLLKSRAGQLADLVTTRAAALHEVNNMRD